MLPPVRPFRNASCLLTLLACATLSSAQIPGVTRDIPYTTDATGSYAADLYDPPTPGVHPAVVAIHGGSWRSGHKSELRHLCTDLATHGYVCFSIDYDTHPRSFPVSWEESRAAVAFLRAHAAEYHVDPDRIAVLGTSAGGQLAALAATSCGVAALKPSSKNSGAGAAAPEPQESECVQAAVGW
ncbi:MAG TPA: alpha/beta hydrolase, partial [Acidobacteriaceae bacterium]|nr:alpha/beta hydrolase [Acidobacteriaceae bacterium]